MTDSNHIKKYSDFQDFHQNVAFFRTLADTSVLQRRLEAASEEIVQEEDEDNMTPLIEHLLQTDMENLVGSLE
jgi:hypothetical protein